MSATVPFGPFPDLSRTIAVYAGLIEALEPVDPTRLAGKTIGDEKNEPRPDDMPGRDVANHPIAQLGPEYTVALRRQLEMVGPPQLTLGREAEITRGLADNVASSQLLFLSDTIANERELLPDGSEGRGRDQGFGALQLAEQAERFVSSDRAIDAILAGFSDMIGHGDQRANSSNHRPTFDRDAGSDTADGYFSGTSNSGPVQEAIGAAADELERLRTTVRRTIDELERVRGSVQPPLPALPVNRGAFRIS